MAKQLKDGTNPLAEVDDGLLKDHQRSSSDLIYECIMRGGGEPFGRPFDIGTSTLTEKTVKAFKQRSFFGFETLERPRKKRRKNPFTRYGSANHRGPLKTPSKKRKGNT